MTRGLAFDTSDKQLFLLLWVKHIGFALTLNKAKKHRIYFNLLCVFITFLVCLAIIHHWKENAL